MALRAQQRRSCAMNLCTSRRWMRARAGALVLAAVCEDVRVDADAAADGDVDEPPCTYPPQPDRLSHIHAAGAISTQRGTTRARRRASASVASVVDG